MKGFITIVAASALLSASLVAGLAATATSRGPRAEQAPVASTTVSGTATTAASTVSAATTWVDPPAKTDAACRGAAWPYRPALCTTTGQATGSQARKVRVISADGRSRQGPATSATPSRL